MDSEDVDYHLPNRFSQVAQALGEIPHYGLPHTDFGGIGYMSELLREIQQALTFETSESPMVAIIDEVVKTYLQAQPTNDLKARVNWLEKKADEACGYLQFLWAREQFIKAFEVHALAAVIARIQGEAVEVEAGKYSLRDIRNVVPLIADKMNAYREEHSIAAE